MTAFKKEISGLVGYIKANTPALSSYNVRLSNTHNTCGDLWPKKPVVNYFFEVGHDFDDYIRSGYIPFKPAIPCSKEPFDYAKATEILTNEDQKLKDAFSAKFLK